MSSNGSIVENFLSGIALSLLCFFFFLYCFVESWQKKSVGLDRKMSNAQAQHKNKEESRNIVSKIGGYYSISK